MKLVRAIPGAALTEMLIRGIGNRTRRGDPIQSATQYTDQKNVQ